MIRFGMQFLRYLGNLLQGDFGPSFKYKDFSVAELIWGGFPTSSLMLAESPFSWLSPSAFGPAPIAALKQNSHIDYTTMGFAMVGIAIPNFVVAPVLTLFISSELGWLPVGGWGETQAHDPADHRAGTAADRRDCTADARQHDRGAPQQLRADGAVKGHAGADYHCAACAEGRDATGRFVSGAGDRRIITGSVIIEQIFGIPGIGRYFVQAALNRDYTLVMGVTIFYGR